MHKPFFLLLISSLLLSAQSGSSLTISEIMEGEDFVGALPTEIRWHGDSRRIYFEWKQPDADEKRGTYVVNRDGSGLRRLPEEELMTAWPSESVWDSNFEKFAGVYEGDLYLYSSEQEPVRMTDTRADESDPQFTNDDSSLYFTRDSNLFVIPLDSAQIRQVTDFRTGDPPEEDEPSPLQEFLAEQQEELFEEFSGEKKREREEKERKEKEKDRRAFYIGKDASVADIKLSPDHRHVTFHHTQQSPSARKTIVPRFVTEDSYTDQTDARPYVGDKPESMKLGIYDVDSGRVQWIPDGDEAYSEVYGPVWNEAGTRAAFLAVSADYKDRWIFLIDFQDVTISTIDHLRDDAWVGGPAYSTFGWLPDDEGLYFVSEEDGFAHLYTISSKGEDRRQLTSGDWEVHSAEISRDDSHWYLSANKDDAGQIHFYRMPIDGGPLERLTSMQGKNDVRVSPDGQYLAILNSFSNRPTELYSSRNEALAEAMDLTDSTTAAFKRYPWQAPTIVGIPASDGATVPARFYRPDNASSESPAAIFVHGAGYLQNAHQWWSSYFREYMFHNFLRDQGYFVLAPDYRGSAGYGRAWRTAVYRHMGGRDLEDHIDSAQWLIDEQGLDPDRIGIYGGSYGGFITLMAMFKAPGTFAAGAALRPVSDWTHYNDWYTRRILTAPLDDQEAYRKSSPIYHAEGLEGALLICHGMVDTNVHFQDSVRLVQRLIELGKENWEMAVYPVEGHAFENASSWTDEYRRIFKLFEENLR